MDLESIPVQRTTLLECQRVRHECVLNRAVAFACIYHFVGEVKGLVAGQVGARWAKAQ